MRVEYKLTSNDKESVTFEYLPEGDETRAGSVRYAKDKTSVEVLRPSTADEKSGYYRHHVNLEVSKMIDSGKFKESGAVIWG